jgi:hypothetical protein
MENWKQNPIIIRPRLSVGSIDFGMTRAEVRERLGFPTTVYNDANFPDFARDKNLDICHYDYFGTLTVEYSSEEKCIAVTVIINRPQFGITWVEDQQISWVEPKQVIAWMRSKDPSTRHTMTHIVSNELGMELELYLDNGNMGKDHYFDVRFFVDPRYASDPPAPNSAKMMAHYTRPFESS